jgi:hypothetical protein
MGPFMGIFSVRGSGTSRVLEEGEEGEEGEEALPIRSCSV